ncbi:hypothetical protein A6A40_20905 (plasmid) [Azospirillum humicireducens]|uniref:Tail fiber protein n=1 Tax=Azospirillum humicireducens TaxID=1226968 RepID=A0A2R4VSQ5_9PROT|nr:hypothetical protein [Azospirillum humicireducens]AWB07488.1 hypothetical protein A6A40_20905 [Azospirillum humicireducens]
MTTLANMLAAAQRLLTYYNGDEKTAQNPGGLTGVGGMADNWDPCIQDIGTVANGVGTAMTAASTSEGNAAASATAAAGSATAANASKLAAATSEGNAAGSATAAANSALAAAGSATAANASKLAAATSEGNAAGSATTATQQAGIAATKAGEAAGSATTATQQAGIATTKAGEAAGSATTATQQAGIAATKASEAAAAADRVATFDPATFAKLASNAFTGKQTIVASGAILPASTGIAGQNNAGALEVQSQMTGGNAATAGAAFISFHRPGNFAAHLGLDTDNKLKYGGWSLGQSAYEIFHAGNLPVTVSNGVINFASPPTVAGNAIGGGEDTAASLAAASTVNLAGTTAKAISITAGAGPINAWGNAPAGVHRDVTFAVAVVLTYNATSAILVGGGGITTMIGDTCRFESLGGGNWRMLSYQRANGMPVGSVVSQSLNPSDKSANVALADGNRTANNVGGGVGSGRAVAAITTPTYWEVVVPAMTNPSIPGIAAAAAPVSDYLTNSALGWGYLWNGYKGNSGQGQAFGEAWGAGERLCFAYHPNSRGFWMGKVVNNVAVWGGGGNPVTGANPAYTIPPDTPVFPCYSVVGAGSSFFFAFGSGQQAASPPSGFLAFT